MHTNNIILILLFWINVTGYFDIDILDMMVSSKIKEVCLVSVQL